MTAFNRGDDVQEEGKYVCVPCGYHHHFRQGEKFSECLSCMAGTEEGHEEFVEGLEMWEKEEASVDAPPQPSPRSGREV